MKFGESSSRIINFLINDFCPPVLRDSFLMKPLFFLAFGLSKWRQFWGFRDRIHSLSSEDMAKIYHDTSDSDLKKHADISSAVIRKIKDACEGSSRILDVGCGRGLLADSLQRSGVDVFGCDVGSRCPGSLRGHYSVARAESLPFSDDYFDVVICSHVLEHIPDIFRALSELRRVASKKVIIVLPIERPYIRGFNLHVWFFPYRYSVLQIVRYGIKESDAFRLIKIKNEWFYLEHFGG